MKCLLLALGVALVCGLRAVDIPQSVAELDLEKVAGTWHTVGMAASDPGLLETPDAPLRAYIKEVRPTAEGDLEVLLSKQVNGNCAETTIVAQKTQDPAVFTYQGKGRISVQDTDNTSFAFFCVEPTQGQVACQYLARTQQGDPEVMHKFKMALETLPVPMRIFLDLTQSKERCRV